MDWRYRIDGRAGVEGWVDEGRARAWARSAAGHYRDARGSSSLGEYLVHWRAARDALNNAVLSLNLPVSNGAGEVNEDAALGVPRIASGSGPTRRAAEQRAFAAHGGPEGFQTWARGLGLPIGEDRYFTAPDGAQWGVRIVPGVDGGEVALVLSDPADALAVRKSLGPLDVEERAAAIERDPWAYYVAARARIDRDNESRARAWGIEDEQGVQSFKLAGDLLGATLGREWEARDKARTQAKFDEMMDRAALIGAFVPVAGWAVAGVAQALKLLGGIIPWVTIEPPAGPRARVQSGGTAPDAGPPTHRVPDPPGASKRMSLPEGLLSPRTGGAQPAGTLGASRGLLRVPTPSPELVLAMQGATSPEAIERRSIGLESGGAGAGAPSGGWSPATIAVAVVVVGGLAYALTRKGR